MRIACCVPKDMNTHSQYVTFIAFLLQKWLHASASVLRYTYIVFLVEYTINCTQHTVGSYHVNVQYKKPNSLHCMKT